MASSYFFGIYSLIITKVSTKSHNSSTPYGIFKILTSSWQGWHCPEGFVVQYKCPEY